MFWRTTGNRQINPESFAAYKPLPLTDDRLEELGQFLMPGYDRDTVSHPLRLTL